MIGGPFDGHSRPRPIFTTPGEDKAIGVCLGDNLVAVYFWHKGRAVWLYDRTITAVSERHCVAQLNEIEKGKYEQKQNGPQAV